MHRLNGYALVRDTSNLLTEYGRRFGPSDDEQGFVAEYLPELRAALSFIDPTRYRGISREPLIASISVDPDPRTAVAMSGLPERLQAAVIAAHEPHFRARNRFRQIIGDDTPLGEFGGDPFADEYDEDLLPTLADAVDVFSLLEAPHDYEIVAVAREPFCPSGSVLGFDIGYWGGDHFSLICDTAIMPLVQPPDRRDFDDLARRLRHLNENVLFATPADARDFLSYYSSRPWAEEETPFAKFLVMEVSLPAIGEDNGGAHRI